MRNNLWIGSGISGMGEIPILGMPVKGLTALIRKIFTGGVQGFAYDPNDLTAEKINWRRNLLTRTTDFTDAAWGKVGAVLAKDNITNPFGSLGVFKICPTTQTPSDCDIRQTVSKKGSGVFSVYLKKAERNFACINVLGRNPTGSEGRLIVDLTTKAVTKLGLQRDFIIQEVGDGWLRVALIFENFVSLDVEVRVQVAENINSYNTTGNGIIGIYAYAPQLEFFTDAPSTYQPITDFNSEFNKQFPLHALYQDAAGTIPVTAQGQPVGLVLDKSKGLALSSNINSVTNIESVPIGGATFNTYPLGGNSVAGKTYLIEFTVSNYSGAGNVTVSGGGSQWLVNPSSLASAPAGNVTYKVIMFALVSAPLLFFTRSTNQCSVSNISVKEVAGNHAYQTVSAMRPLLVAAPQRLDYDAVDDNLITNLPTQLTGCTVVRSVPNVGAQILTNQTIPTPYNDNIDNCGLIVINRALTASETSQITKLFNKAAGV